MKKNINIALVFLISIGLTAAAFFLFLPTAKQAYTNKFAIQNNVGTEVFRIGDDGELTNYGQGQYDQNSSLLPAANKPVAWEDGFEIRNSNNQIIFYVEANGNVHLDGTIHQVANSGNNLNFPGGNNNFIIENNTGDVVAYITNAGHLYLKNYIVGSGSVVYAFVTQGTHNGDFNGLSGADSYCSAQALAAGLANPSRYKAWLSDSTATAANRLNHMDGEQFVLIGTNNRLVSNGLPIGVNLINPLNRDQYGVVINSIFDVFTDTDGNGNLVNGLLDCNNWNNNYGYNSITGDLREETDPYWTNNVTNTCNEFKRIYCFAQPVVDGEVK